MRALITGATGFIGRELVRHIEQPVVLSRNADAARGVFPGVECHAWDPASGPPPAEAFRDVEVVFNLAGESIGEGRWTTDKKQRIRASRVQGTENLLRGISQLESRPRVLVSGSAIGIYGSRGDEPLDESSPAGSDFLADVCREWEQAAMAAESRGLRVVCIRTGIVLGPGGGALAKMLLPFKLCLGGRLGSGRQWMSWIHLADEVGLLLHAAKSDAVAGPMNATAPSPVTNREFTKALASALGRPAIFPVPALALRLLIGEFAEALLGSQRVLPRAAESSGYAFRHPELAGALADILK